MRDLVSKPAPYVAVFPDTVLLGVKVPSGHDLVDTVARNRSYKSVEFIFSEGVELEPAEDTLQIIDGFASSRPNLVLSVDIARLDEFVTRWRALQEADGSWGAFVAQYAARRSGPAFWNTFDFFTDAYTARDPVAAAVLDLSRYTND
jgi:hypothetical protein